MPRAAEGPRSLATGSTWSSPGLGRWARGRAAGPSTGNDSPQHGTDLVSTRAILLLSRWLPPGLILLGILLRLVQYLANRSLWVDEALLASNIVDKSPLELLGPLDKYPVAPQVAPLGFLFLARGAVDAFGPVEYALRLVPLVAGIAALPLFYEVAKASVRPRAVPLALGLFAISHPLIYYASEVKQYSSDVAGALVLQVAALHLLSRTPSPGRLTVLAIAGVVLIWVSHPAIFVLAGIGTTLAVLHLTTGRPPRPGGLFLVGTSWILSFLANHAIHLRHAVRHAGRSPYWSDFWRDAFMPWPPVSFDALAWFPRTFFEIFAEPGGLALSGVAALAFVVGTASAIARRRVQLLLILSPLAFALLASGLRQYPFGGRLLLFAVPSFLLLIAEGVEEIHSKTDVRLLGPALTALLLFHPVVCAAYHLIRPEGREEIKPVLSHVSRHRRPGDVVYLYYGARWAFDFYADRYGLREDDVIQGTASRGNWRRYGRELGGLRGRGRVWVLFSHVHAASGVDEEAFFLYYLDAIGQRLDVIRAPGAAAYLYDLSGASPGTGDPVRSPAATPPPSACCPEGAPLDACRGISTPPTPFSWTGG